MDAADIVLPNSTTPALDARLLREHAGADEVAFAAYMARRAAGEPVAQIIGSKGFWTLELQVTRDVLTPRPDSETILDALLKHSPDKDADLRILDLGTGSGCLILAALSEYKNASGDAVDVSAEALAVARGNAERVAIKQRVEFYHGSWCAPLPDEKKYDVILTNPPYIPTADIDSLSVDVRDHEPRGALDGGIDGLECYRTLAKQMQMRMLDGAIALIEVGAGQAHEVAAIMKQGGLTLIEIRNDLAGIARVVVCEKPAISV